MKRSKRIACAGLKLAEGYRELSAVVLDPGLGPEAKSTLMKLLANSELALLDVRIAQLAQQLVEEGGDDVRS